MRRRLTAVLVWMACPALHAQTFDAASVKPVPSAQWPMAPKRDPGRAHYSAASLKNLLMEAYDLGLAFELSGPNWLDSSSFEIDVTMPPGTTGAQFRVMLRNLLAERFHLAVHREDRQLQAYSLTLAKSGPKMKASGPGPAASDTGPIDRPARVEVGPDGFIDLPLPPGRPILRTQRGPGRARLQAQRQTMQDLAQHLAFVLNAPVTDATGLSGAYDFVVVYAGEGPIQPDGDPLPDLFSAIQTQLGLRLEKTKASAAILVVDRVDRSPVPN